MERKESVINMGSPLLVEEASSQNRATDSKDVESGDADDSNYADSEVESKSGSDKAKEDGGRMSNVYFHFVMTLASCYVAMLLTSWGTGSTIEATGKISMIVNVVCQYITAILFWWTLCAPKICPSRFANEEE